MTYEHQSWIETLDALRRTLKPLFVSPRAHSRHRSAALAYNAALQVFARDVRRLVDAQDTAHDAEIEELMRTARVLCELRDKLAREIPG